MKTFEDIIISLCRRFYVTISHKLGVDYIVINTPPVTENAAKIAIENDFPELSFYKIIKDERYCYIHYQIEDK